VPCKIQLRSYLIMCLQLKTPKLLRKGSLSQEAQLYSESNKLTLSKEKKGAKVCSEAKFRSEEKGEDTKQKAEAI
jgi:hypothetical protein